MNDVKYKNHEIFFGHAMHYMISNNSNKQFYRPVLFVVRFGTNFVLSFLCQRLRAQTSSSLRTHQNQNHKHQAKEHLGYGAVTC